MVVTTLKYHLAAFMLLSFLDGLVPWVKWACVQWRSLHLDWIANQDARQVNGSLALPCWENPESMLVKLRILQYEV